MGNTLDGPMANESNETASVANESRKAQATSATLDASMVKASNEAQAASATSTKQQAPSLRENMRPATTMALTVCLAAIWDDVVEDLAELEEGINAVLAKFINAIIITIVSTLVYAHIFCVLHHVHRVLNASPPVESHPVFS